MSKFIFQLESALKYRRSIEEQETARLVRAKQKVQAEEGMANKLNLEKRKHLSTFGANELTLTSMQQQEAYLSLLDLRIKKQLDKLDQAKEYFGVQLSRLVEASTKRKSLETLREKSLDEYRSVLSKAEQNILDDIGITAYCHKVSI